MPSAATRPTSLRPRSSSIRCSARSFGSASSSASSAWSSSYVVPRRRVPASGRIVTVPSRSRTSTSGLEPTTAKPPKSRKNRNGAGLIRRSARYSENGGSANGTEKRWLMHDLERVARRDVLLAPVHRGEELRLGEIGRRRRRIGQHHRRRLMRQRPFQRRLGLVEPRLRLLPRGLGRRSPALRIDRRRPASVRRSRCRRSRTASAASSAPSGTPITSRFFAGSRSICRTMS